VFLSKETTYLPTVDHKLPYVKRSLVALAFATLIKLYLALSTLGSPDVLGYQDYLVKIRSFGGIGSYYAGGAYANPFNVPPLNIPVIRLMGWLADTTDLPFRFWLRLPCILADIASFLLVCKLLTRTNRRPSFSTLLLFALCPASIMISGFHGNSDPVMISLVILSIYIIEIKRTVWLAAIVFGLALSIKVVPLIFLPAFMLYLPTLRQKSIFISCVTTVFLTGSLPYVVQDPGIIAAKVFGYGSYYGVWGWPRLLYSILGPSVDSSHPTGSHMVANRMGKVLLLLSIVAVSLWMNRRSHKQPLFVQCGLVSFLFMFLTPGFGIQYLSWCLPFVVYLGLWPTAIFYLASSIFLFIDYNCWAYWPTPPGYCLTKIPSLASIICWMVIIIVLMVYRRHLKLEPESQ